MKRLLIIAGVLIALGVLSIFIFTPRLPDGTHTVASVAVTPATPVITLVSLHDSYRRGKHTVTGALTVPTPCYVVTAQSSLVPSTTPQVIRLNLSVPADTGRCLLLSATTTFSVVQKATRSAFVKAYVNGTFATST